MARTRKTKDRTVVSIDEFNADFLADMVRTGTYTKGETFGATGADKALGARGHRFLLVFAVPYGPADEVNTLEEALYSFHRFLADDDWRERNIQVYDHATGRVTETSMEVEELRDRPKFYQCPMCERYHVAGFTGDCREKGAGVNPEELDETYGAQGWEEEFQEA